MVVFVIFIVIVGWGGRDIGGNKPIDVSMSGRVRLAGELLF